MISNAEALVVRAACLYAPMAAVAVALWRGAPDRRRVAAGILATAWNLPALLAVNVVAVHLGWWSFVVGAPQVAGVPADLWIGWALLWGAVPALVAPHRTALAVTAFAALDIVVMPLATSVMTLSPSWLLGEAVAIGVSLVPGLLLARWTAAQTHLTARVVLQLVTFTALMHYALPSVVFSASGDTWAELLARPRWYLVAAAVAVAPVAAMALQAVIEFRDHGGTPLPLDPPASLVTTGPYAYIANPMQLGGTLLLAAWGIVIASPLVVAGALVAASFSAGVAAWVEGGELTNRFDGWSAYRGAVRTWLPRWRPRGTRTEATVYLASSCDPCSEVARFLIGCRPSRLHVAEAELHSPPLRRVTYVCEGHTDDGVAAIGRSLEHVHLGWAVASWMLRMPGVRPLIQLVADAVGAGPRDLTQVQQRERAEGPGAWGSSRAFGCQSNDRR